MKDFKRAFGATLSIVLLLIIGMSALSLISTVSEASGFSSGEFLSVELEQGVLKTEFLGERFKTDFRPLLYAADFLKPAAVLLPPALQLALRLGERIS
ncbi:MAG: hypothetical protein ACI4IW_06985 [Oscillospiraceae bacterium]